MDSKDLDADSSMSSQRETDTTVSTATTASTAQAPETGHTSELPDPGNLKLPSEVIGQEEDTPTAPKTIEDALNATLTSGGSSHTVPKSVLVAFESMPTSPTSQEEPSQALAQDSAEYESHEVEHDAEQPATSPPMSPFHELSPSSLPPPAVPLEVDSQPSDETDSALGDLDSLRSSTASVRSSIYDYVVEHGRTYHAYNRGKYMLPNDEQEQERLDLQHHLFLLTFGLHLAPINPNPQNVLDIATGTGIWAIDFADKYPSATVTGTDLSPIQPLYVPANCQFEVSDAEEEWTYSKKFDYIHGRALMTCFKEPKSIAVKAYEALAPGGWLELQDPITPLRGLDDTINGTALKRWVELTMEGAEKLGRSWDSSNSYRQNLEEVGFVDIEEHVFQWPIGTWPRGQHQKTLGLWFQQDLLDGVHALSMAILTRGLGWTPEQVELLLVDVRKDLKNRNIHAYVDVVVVFGRKPVY